MTLLLLAATIATLMNARRRPVIDDVNPTVASPGTVITVVGHDFSETGRLEIDGIALPAETIRRWEESIVVFEATERMKSGLLRITTGVGPSNEVFVSNTATLPQAIQKTVLQVDDLQPRSARIGDTVRIIGRGFGPHTGLSTISLSARFESWDITGAERWIVSWSDEIIEFLVPPRVTEDRYALRIDGAETGLTLEIASPGGRVVLGEDQRYTFHQGVRVANVVDSARAVIPVPASNLYQSYDTILRETTDSNAVAAGGAAVYRFRPSIETDPDSPTDETEGTEVVLLDRIEREDLLYRRSAVWNIEEEIDSHSFLDPVFREAFADLLAPVVMKPDISERIDAIGRTDIDLREDAITIVESIYKSVISRLEPGLEGASTIDIALDTTAAPAVYADLALALGRQSGIPGRRVYGVLLLDSGETVPHRWVEFFVPHVGWYPIDPALGDEAYGTEIVSLGDFYADSGRDGPIGAIDGRRIALSFDGDRRLRLFPGAGIVVPENPYAPMRQQIEFPTVEIPLGFDARWEVPILSPQFN